MLHSGSSPVSGRSSSSFKPALCCSLGIHGLDHWVLGRCGAVGSRAHGFTDGHLVRGVLRSVAGTSNKD